MAAQHLPWFPPLVVDCSSDRGSSFGTAQAQMVIIRQ
jgi:hypothetical protein